MAAFRFEEGPQVQGSRREGSRGSAVIPPPQLMEPIPPSMAHLQLPPLHLPAPSSLPLSQLGNHPPCLFSICPVVAELLEKLDH